MKQVGRKAASILLTLCMLLTMLPVSALAAASQDCSGGDSCKHEAAIGTTHYDTIGEAIDAANKTSGSDTITVTLLKDATLKGGEQSGHYKIKRILKNITLDLGDNTLTYSENGGFAVDPNCHFTIRNGIYINNSTDEYAQAIEGTKRSYTGPGCTITIAEDAVIQAAYGICADGHTTINVYGKIISTVDGIFGSGPKNKVTLDGAQIEAGVYGVYQQGYDGGSTYTIKNSTITTPSTGATCGVFISNNKDSSEDTEEQGMQTLNIENSVISGQDGIEVRYTNVTISGDQTKVTSAEDGYALGVTHNGSESAVGNLSITGGTFKGVIGFMEGTANTATLTISGGNFSFAIPEEYCAKGFKPVENADGTWSVKEEEETPPEPTGVAQIGNTKYETLEAAFAAVGSEEATIKLLADTQISKAINVAADKTVVLDLNGCAVTVPAAVNGKSIYAIYNYGILTIRDTSATKDGSINSRGIENNGTMTLESGTINSIDSNGGGAAMWNEATFYMTGGTLAFTGEKSGNSAGAPLNNQFGATATITGGSLRSPYTCVFNSGRMKISDVSLAGQTAYWHVIKTYGGSDLELHNVNVSATLGGGIEAAGGTVDIYNCTFTQTGYYDHNSMNVAVSNNGTVNIHSGTFTSENYSAYVFSSGGTINIEDGTFNAGRAVLKADNSTTSNPSVINVAGGAFTGGLEIGSSSTLSISGGTFTAEIREEYCAEGFKPKQNEDGTWGVVTETTYVAQIGETKYATLSEALNAVTDGETIKILAPATVKMTETYAITGKTITLDLNGQTVTWNTSAVCAFDVMTGGNLTIQDTSTQETGALNIISTYATSTANSGIRVNASGSLNLTGGTVSYHHDSKTGYGAIQVKTGGTFTMSGGTVKISGYVDHGIRLSGGTGTITGGAVEFGELTNPSTYSMTYGVYVTAATCTINNLLIDASEVAALKKVSCVYGKGSSSHLTIAGGTYTANSNDGSYAFGSDVYHENTMITGGTFNGQVNDVGVTITDGRFSVLAPVGCLPKGKVFQKQTDDYYHVVNGTYVARIGDVGYLDWETLFADASSGTAVSTIYIMSDAENITVPQGKNVVLNNNSGYAIGTITNNGTCTLGIGAMNNTKIVNNGTLELRNTVGSVINNMDATFKVTSTALAPNVTGTMENHGIMSIVKGTFGGDITNDGTLTITGGTFRGDVTSTGTSNITGGTFATDIKKLCAEGYTTEKNAEGTWNVVKNVPKVAEVNDNQYTTLEAAIAAAKDGDRVTLLADVKLVPATNDFTQVIAITEDITLDLAEHTISWSEEAFVQTEDPYHVHLMFSIQNGAKVTITGNGVIDTEAGPNNAYGINLIDSSTLTIENGTFTGAPTAVQVESGSLTILDGTFIQAKTIGADAPKFANYVVNAIDANWADGTANISIRGGSFCFDPSDNPEGTGSSYVAEGFEATTSADGKFEVVKSKVAEIVDGIQYETLTAAINAATDGQTIKLLADSTGNTSVKISNGRKLTLNMNGFNAGFIKNNNISICHGGLNIIGSGKLYEEEPYLAPVLLYGSDHPQATDYTTVTVGKGVTLEGWAGLFIDKLAANSGGANAFGIKATVNGKLNSVKDIYGAGGHALYVNGTISATKGNVPEISLDGATLNTNVGNGMYLAGYAKTTITDSTITSTSENSTGIEIRAGQLTISGNTTVSGGNGEFVVTPNGNGSTTGNVALAVVQHTSKLPVVVTVEGGTFNGGAALFEQNAQNNDQAAIEKVQLSVEGGTFNGTVYSENKTGFITGGSFNAMPDDAYLAEGLAAPNNGSGMYVVCKAPVDAVAMIGGEGYETLPAALNAAKTAANKVVTLVDNVEVEDVFVSAGVTLDLAGKNLTATGSMTAFGYVVDSSEGQSLLKIPEYYFMQSENPSLPIYDSADAGYRMYTYRLTTLQAYVPADTPDSVQFWFRLTFTNPEAWNLMETGKDDHGVLVQSKYQFSGQPKNSGWFDFSSFVHQLADQLGDATTQDDLAFYLNVTNIHLLGDQTMTVIPTVDSLFVGTESAPMTYPQESAE